MPRNPLLTLRQVADRLGCSSRQVRTLSHRDGFPRLVYLSDGVPRVFERDLETYMRRHERSLLAS